MRKSIYLLGISFLLLAPLGCGGGSPTPPGTPGADQSAVATPVFKDGFEKGKPEAWQQSPSEEKTSTETPEDSLQN